MRKLLKNEEGDSLIEFALAAIVLFTCIFGIIDCSRALYAYHFASYAAREATRYAMVRGSTWGSTTCTSVTTFNCNASAANVKSYVQNIVPLGIDSGTPLVVNTTWPGTELAGSATTCTTTNGNNSPGCLVKVVMTYSFNYVTPLMPATTLTFSSTSEAVIQQ
jgi:Flp pilus assembly protein TadG